MQFLLDLVAFYLGEEGYHVGVVLEVLILEGFFGGGKDCVEDVIIVGIEFEEGCEYALIFGWWFGE